MPTNVSQCIVIQGDHSPDNVEFPDNSLTVRGTPAHVKCCSYHDRLTVLVLLSGVRVGTQHCMIQNQKEMHKLSKVKNGCKYATNNIQF